MRRLHICTPCYTKKDTSSSNVGDLRMQLLELGSSDAQASSFQVISGLISLSLFLAFSLPLHFLPVVLSYLSLPVCRVLADSDKTIDKQSRGSWLCGAALGWSWYSLESRVSYAPRLCWLHSPADAALPVIEHASRAGIHEEI